MRNAASSNAWGMFCSCFEDAGDIERTDTSGPVAGRIMLPASFRDLPKSQKTYWNPLRTNGAYCYWRMLDAAGQDSRRALVFCSEEYGQVVRALESSEAYRTYFARYRGAWQTRTQWWYEATHPDEIDEGRGRGAAHPPREMLGPREELRLWRYQDDYGDRGPRKLAGWCCKRASMKKTIEDLRATRTYPEMLKTVYAAPYNDGLRLESIYRLLLKHLDWRHCEQRGVRVRDAYFADAPEFACAFDRFKEAFFRIQNEIERFDRLRDASYGSAGEGPATYFAIVARQLAAQVEGRDLRECFLDRLERMADAFVAQLHADRPSADHLNSDEVVRSDAFALGRYLELVRQGDERFRLEHLMYHVVKALASGRFEKIERLREGTRASEAEKPGLPVPCTLHVVQTPVSDAVSFPLDERVEQFVCGRKDECDAEAQRPAPEAGNGRRPLQVYDDWTPWGFVYNHCFDISRRQFTLAYDAVRQDWKLTVIGKSLYCRSHEDVATTIANGGMHVGRLAGALGEGGSPASVECAPGVRDVLLEEGAWVEGDGGRWWNDGDWAYLKELAWFAVPYREDGDDEERVRYVQVYTEYLG